jgi:para-nitrobenzyl esterase
MKVFKTNAMLNSWFSAICIYITMHFVLIITIQQTLNGQVPICQPLGRYNSEVFTCVDTLVNRAYGQGRVDWIWNNLLCLDLRVPPYTQTRPLLFDWYEPCGDTVEQRPLIILVHGGAWSEGRKEDFSEFGRYYARKGFAVASINYRLSLPSNILCWNQDADAIRLHRAAFRGVVDTKSAIRFFKANANNYKIHPDRIFLIGASAGAFNVLGAAFLDQESERPDACKVQPQLGDWFGEWLYPDLGSVEGESPHMTYSTEVHAVVNIAGAIWTPDLFAGQAKSSLLNIHGEKDDVVPFDTDCLLPAVRASGLFQHCIPSIGSRDLHALALQEGISSSLFSIPNATHAFTTAQIMAISSRIDAFLCEQLSPISSTYNYENKVEAKLFPNPTSHMVQLKVSEEGLFTLFDLRGLHHLSIRCAQGENLIELPNIPLGHYAWKFTTSKGSVTGKLMLSHP